MLVGHDPTGRKQEAMNSHPDDVIKELYGHRILVK